MVKLSNLNMSEVDVLLLKWFILKFLMLGCCIKSPVANMLVIP